MLTIKAISIGTTIRTHINMLITESQLRYIIREAILQEAWYHDLFGLDDKDSIAAKNRAKSNLELLKKNLSKGMSFDDAIDLVSSKNEKYIDTACSPTYSDRIDDLEEEHEEIEDMLYNSMSRREQKDWLKQKSKRRQRKMKDGTYYSDLALNFE